MISLRMDASMGGPAAHNPGRLMSRNRYVVCMQSPYFRWPAPAIKSGKLSPPSHREHDPEISLRKARDDGEIQHVLVGA